MVAAGGDHEENLGLGIPPLGRSLDQEAPNLLGAWRTAGLARSDGREAGLLQRFDQEPGVR